MAGAATLAQGVDRRQSIVTFLQKYLKENGYGPSVEEISSGVGVGKTAVRHHLVILKEDGHITMDPNRYRSIRLGPRRNRKVK